MREDRLARFERSGDVTVLKCERLLVSRRSLWPALLAIMIGVGAVSAFVNNTAAVAIFLPIMPGRRVG